MHGQKVSNLPFMPDFCEIISKWNTVDQLSCQLQFQLACSGRYKDGELNVGENSCIDRCSSKYWQVTDSAIPTGLADSHAFFCMDMLFFTIQNSSSAAREGCNAPASPASIP